jgi:hypothetical protein
MALVVNALLSLRIGWVSDRQAIMALALLLLLAAAAIHGVGQQRRRQLMREAVPVGPRAGAMLAVASVTLVAAMVGLWSMRIRG